LPFLLKWFCLIAWWNRTESYWGFLHIYLVFKNLLLAFLNFANLIFLDLNFHALSRLL